MYKGNNVFIQKLLIFINMIILPVIIVLAWHFATSTGAMSTLILPKISTVLETLKEQLGNGTLTGDIGISLSRIAKGYALAVVVGILLGVLMGMNKFANRFFMLTFTAIRQIPMIAWVPILIIWFGIGEESKVAVIFLAAYFPVLVNTVSGIERTDPKLIEVGKVSSELLAAVYKNLSAICTSVHFRRIKTGAECILDGSGRCRDDRSHIRYRFSYQRCTKPDAVSGCICRNHCHRSRWCDHGSGHFTDWKIMHTLGKRQVSTNGKDIINSERK